MLRKRYNSLPRLLFIQEAILLFLLALTGLLGGLSAYLWQKNSAESIRLNDLIYVTERIRSELFQQIQVAVRVKLFQDSLSIKRYQGYSSSIDKKFNRLYGRTISRKEDVAVHDMHKIYREIQQDMNAIFNDSGAAVVNRMKILSPRFSERIIDRFEHKYAILSKLLIEQNSLLNDKLEVWSEYSAIVITIPLVLALCLVIYARSTFHKEFLRPVSAVISGAGLISTGQLGTRIKEHGVYEVKNLAVAINKMARDLQISQAALVENEKQAALGALVPVVAHNIRNPLASIRAAAQVLDNFADRREMEEGKQAIIQTTDRLSGWVSALVSYLHPLKPNYRQTRITEMIEAALLLLQSKIEQKRINIHRVDWRDDIRLNVDRDLMEQAIYVLTDNAIEASPIAATITIGLASGADKMLIYIQDQGEGLPFEPTSMGALTPGPSTKNFGTGLGLPIAFKICEKHGWNLSFESAPGAGTKVIISAPVDQNKQRTG